MITTILSTIVLFALLVGMMAIGVILRGRPLSGSCGGIPGSSCKCSTEERTACERSATDDPEDDDNPLKQYPG